MHEIGHSFVAFSSLSESLPSDLSERAAHDNNLPNPDQGLNTLQGEPGVQAQPLRIGGANEKKRGRGEEAYEVAEKAMELRPAMSSEQRVVSAD